MGSFEITAPVFVEVSVYSVWPVRLSKDRDWHPLTHDRGDARMSKLRKVLHLLDEIAFHFLPLIARVLFFRGVLAACPS